MFSFKTGKSNKTETQMAAWISQQINFDLEVNQWYKIITQVILPQNAKFARDWTILRA